MNRIKQLRKILKLTQGEFAERIGAKQSAVSSPASTQAQINAFISFFIRSPPRSFCSDITELPQWSQETFFEQI